MEGLLSRRRVPYLYAACVQRVIRFDPTGFYLAACRTLVLSGWRCGAWIALTRAIDSGVWLRPSHPSPRGLFSTSARPIAREKDCFHLTVGGEGRTSA